MAAIQAPFTGQETKLYAKASAHSLASLVAGDLVGEVQNIGDMELSANVIEVSKYGSAYKGKLVGQKDSGTIDISLNWVPDSSTQSAQALMQSSYSSGAKVYFVVVWADADAGLAACEFSGYVQSYSISQPLEDVVTVNVSINIDGAVTFDTDGTLGS
jgi:hypothetical protein